MTSITIQKHELREAIQNQVMALYAERRHSRFAITQALLMRLTGRLSLGELKRWIESLQEIDAEVIPDV